MATNRKRCLEELEGDRWRDPPAGSTRLVTVAHQLRRKPIGDLSVEDLRLLIGQEIGLLFLVPVALDLLESEPLAAGDLYEGDLLRAVLRVDDGFWERQPQLAEQARSVVDAVTDRPNWLDAEVANLPRP